MRTDIETENNTHKLKKDTLQEMLALSGQWMVILYDYGEYNIQCYSIAPFKTPSKCMISCMLKQRNQLTYLLLRQSDMGSWTSSLTEWEQACLLWNAWRGTCPPVLDDEGGKTHHNVDEKEGMTGTPCMHVGGTPQPRLLLGVHGACWTNGDPYVQQQNEHETALSAQDNAGTCRQGKHDGQCITDVWIGLLTKDTQCAHQIPYMVSQMEDYVCECFNDVPNDEEEIDILTK